VYVFRFAEKYHAYFKLRGLQVARCHKSIASIVPFSAKHAHAHVFAARDHVPNGIGGSTAGVFHQSQAGYAKSRGRQMVDLTHLGCSKGFHLKKLTVSLEHPSAAHV
jgi:hypothetical protein